MLIQALLLLAGLLLGALLNIMIVRLPRSKGLWGWPRCTRTGERLALWQLIPLLGWLLQGGRARDGRPIAWIYPLVELLSALLLLRLYQLYALSAEFFYLAFVCAILLLTGAIDWLHRYIYTFLVLGASLIALMVGPMLGMDWRNLLLGALFGGVSFYSSSSWPGCSSPGLPYPLAWVMSTWLSSSALWLAWSTWGRLWSMA